MAWQAVCPSVLLLRKFYEFALELETALCDLLTVLCSPGMAALQHLEQQQVTYERECVCVPLHMYICEIDRERVYVHARSHIHTCMCGRLREREMRDKFCSSQAITKQFAEILHFTLSFDDLKV